MYATFTAKPIAGEPGSAMHMHQIILDRESQQNIFSNPDGTPTQAFFHYIGGFTKVCAQCDGFGGAVCQQLPPLVALHGCPHQH
jgi:glutamine synthetase